MPRSTLNARWINQSSPTTVMNSEPGIPAIGTTVSAGTHGGCISGAV